MNHHSLKLLEGFVCCSAVIEIEPAPSPIMMILRLLLPSLLGSRHSLNLAGFLEYWTFLGGITLPQQLLDV